MKITSSQLGERISAVMESKAVMRNVMHKVKVASFIGVLAGLFLVCLGCLSDVADERPSSSGEQAVESLERRLLIDEEKTVGDSTIRIVEVRLSSTEIVLRASADPSAILTLVLPDGTRVIGEGGGGSTTDPPDQVREYHFPPIPPGVEAFTITQEPFLRDEQMILSFEFSLQAESQNLDLGNDPPTTIELDQPREVYGEELTLTKAEIGQGFMVVTIENRTPDGMIAPFSSTGIGIGLRDSAGRGYQPSHGSKSLPSNANRPISVSASFPQVDLSAGSFEVILSGIGHVTRGPEFQIELR